MIMTVLEWILFTSLAILLTYYPLPKVKSICSASTHQIVQLNNFLEVMYVLQVALP